MKVVKSEFNNDAAVLRMYGAHGISAGSYIDEHWLLPVEDGVEQMGFFITDKTSGTPPENRDWVSTLVNSTFAASTSEEAANTYLRWYFKSLAESVMFKHHVTIDANLYSEILLYEEIDKLIDYMINSSRTSEEEPEPEPDIQPTGR